MNHMNKLLLILRHIWLDSADSHRLIPDDMARRLTQRVAASEARHSGEVRLCVEASLPLSCLWRLGSGTSLHTLTRYRAVHWFSRLGVWDTESNNGVLIYLLLAERQIEFVADRGLRTKVNHLQWQEIVNRLGSRLRMGAFEDGLTQALEEVSALLVNHFPVEAGTVNPDELHNGVIRV